jgi:hypothetical protein
MRITGIAHPHRAFRQSADAKLTVPFCLLKKTFGADALIDGLQRALGD